MNNKAWHFLSYPKGSTSSIQIKLLTNWYDFSSQNSKLFLLFFKKKIGNISSFYEATAVTSLPAGHLAASMVANPFCHSSKSWRSGVRFKSRLFRSRCWALLRAEPHWDQWLFNFWFMDLDLINWPNNYFHSVNLHYHVTEEYYLKWRSQNIGNMSIKWK